MKYWKQNLYRSLFIFACFSFLLTSCRDDDNSIEPPKEPVHTEATTALMKICDTNAEVKQLLTHAIAQAASINPDRDYNPAQTLEEFYDFVDWNVRQLPWDVMIKQAPDDYGRSLYGRTDQGIGYFWFVVDQPLEELEGRGYFYPTVEFVEPFSTWLSTYSNTWGAWLDTEASWNATYYNMAMTNMGRAEVYSADDIQKYRNGNDPDNYIPKMFNPGLFCHLCKRWALQ